MSALLQSPAARGPNLHLAVYIFMTQVCMLLLPRIIALSSYCKHAIDQTHAVHCWTHSHMYYSCFSLQTCNYGRCGTGIGCATVESSCLYHTSTGSLTCRPTYCSPTCTAVKCASLHMSFNGVLPTYVCTSYTLYTLHTHCCGPPIPQVTFVSTVLLSMEHPCVRHPCLHKSSTGLLEVRKCPLPGLPPPLASRLPLPARGRGPLGGGRGPLGPLGPCGTLCWGAGAPKHPCMGEIWCFGRQKTIRMCCTT